jgi:hypothetical protein
MVHLAEDDRAVFQIGQHLADRRRRLRLTLAECETATRIRAKYLAAIEEDRADDVLDRAYARLFIRGYATFLGADADAIIAEYDDRHGDRGLRAQHELVPPEPPAPGRIAGIRRWLVSPSRRFPRREAAWVGIGLVGMLMVLVWAGSRGTEPPRPAQPAPAADSAPVRRAAVAQEPSASRRPAAATRVRLTIAGESGGGSYVRVQRGGPAGPVVYEGTVYPGQTVRLRARRSLWMRVGWAPNLRVSVNGRPAPLGGGTGNFTVTPAAVASAG